MQVVTKQSVLLCPVHPCLCISLLPLGSHLAMALQQLPVQHVNLVAQLPDPTQEKHQKCVAWDRMESGIIPFGNNHKYLWFSLRFVSCSLRGEVTVPKSKTSSDVSKLNERIKCVFAMYSISYWWSGYNSSLWTYRCFVRLTPFILRHPSTLVGICLSSAFQQPMSFCAFCLFLTFKYCIL